MSDAFDMPLPHRLTRAPEVISSAAVEFLGSRWRLDVKRCVYMRLRLLGVMFEARYLPSSTPGQFNIAVYLRRLALERPSAGMSSQAMYGVLLLVLLSCKRSLNAFSAASDGRSQVAVAFTIRLCGSPGACITNSICGRSVVGKSFGCSPDSSWDWEGFINTSHFSRSDWRLGNSMRFIVTLELL